MLPRGSGIDAYYPQQMGFVIPQMPESYEPVVHSLQLK